jgi:hypothetical protein
MRTRAEPDVQCSVTLRAMKMSEKSKGKWILLNDTFQSLSRNKSQIGQPTQARSISTKN